MSSIFVLLPCTKMQNETYIAIFAELYFSFDGNGNPPPYYAGHGERGRGLFASRDIKKGELVHDGSKSDIQFPSDDDGLAWRRLVFNLPRNKACDVIDWSWTAQTEKGGKYKLFSAVDISVLCNGGNDDTINVNPLSEFTSEMYATRDIKKGEELLMDYDTYESVWEDVGLGGVYVDDNDAKY